MDDEDIWYLVVGDDSTQRYEIIDDGTDITDRDVRVNGTVIYWVRDMNDLGECDPSSYVAFYDTVAPSLELLNDEYMRVWDPEPVDGKVVFNSRDANWGLYAQKVSKPLKPIALTPHEYNVVGSPEVDSGIAVFKALDRDNVLDPGNGENSMEVYYVDLSTSAKALNRVTMNEEMEDRIHTEGGLIVYNLVTSDHAMLYDVDSATSTTLWTNPDGGDAYLGVGDGIAAWRANDGGGNKIYYYDTEAASPEVQVLDWTDNLGIHPRVVGDVIVWRGDDHIYYHQVGDPLDSIGQASVNAVLQQPDFDGDFVVWGGIGDNILWYFDMVSAEAYTISGTVVYGSVRVSDGIASWTQNNDSDGDLEVFYCDLNAATIATVKLTDNELWDSRARNKNGTIVFRTGGSFWNWDLTGKIAAAARR